ALTVLTGLLFGVAPALRAARTDPAEALREGGRASSGGRGSHRSRAVLVASQVTVALMLLVGAGLLMRSFAALQRVDLGFETDDVATFEVHLGNVRYQEPERRVQLHGALRDHLRAIPGVLRVGATSWLPANGPYHNWGYGYADAGGETHWTPAMVRVIHGDYFQALGIPLLRGRTFAPSDRLDTDGVALISASLAERAYGSDDPLGRSFQTGGKPFRVIGVVGDVAYQPNGARSDHVYLSHDQFATDRTWALTYVVSTSVPPDRIMAPARQALATVDPALVLHQPRSMSAVVARHLARDRFTLLLMGVFATVALSLAAVGVYGVLSYAVTQRTREIGVRMALGAHAGQVRTIVLRQAAIVAGMGMMVGLGGALLLSRLLESLVFQVGPRDPLVFGAVVLSLIAVALAASVLPVRRATRVNPLEALRAE
ncbi:MAG TPA: FtsX-like permease family protein, partial [Gemmatimonadales bacterium]|nr:FtsX-like permease family protein [Gemmatimonadales bacterium]